MQKLQQKKLLQKKQLRNNNIFLNERYRILSPAMVGEPDYGIFFMFDFWYRILKMSIQIKTNIKTKINLMAEYVQKIKELFPYSFLEKELKSARFVKETEHGGNQIYTFSGRDCPRLMEQVGILREMSFRNGGGGTGLSIDIDRWDEYSDPDQKETYAVNGFKQLIVWDPEAKEIIGGYRYALMKHFINEPCTTIDSPTTDMFDYSDEFVRFYAPFTIELGRSFVQPKYQQRVGYMPPRKAIYALDNLFDGLGTLFVDHKDDDIEYFFGKVTMYKTYNREARNMILYYMSKHFPDRDGLVSPKPNLVPEGLNDEIALLQTLFDSNNEKADRKILITSLRKIKEGMPPLFKKYTEMSPTMKMFGTAVNHHCGEVEETAIMTKISDIVEEYKENYIRNYFQKKFGKLFH